MVSGHKISTVNMNPPLAVTISTAQRKQMSGTLSVLTVKVQTQTIHFQNGQSFHTPLPILSQSPNTNLPRVFHPRSKRSAPAIFALQMSDTLS